MDPLNNFAIQPSKQRVDLNNAIKFILKFNEEI